MLHQIKSQQYEISTANLGNVALSNVTKNSQLTLSADQRTVHGIQGYRTVLGTHGMSRGTYYYECSYALPRNCSEADLREPEYRPQVRVGFGTLGCCLDGPVGFDEHGVALRSVDCSVCTGRERLFGSARHGTVSHSSFQVQPGQVIGCLIHVPEGYETETVLPDEVELCESKQATRICLRRACDEAAPPQEAKRRYVLPPAESVPGSYVRFYVDGALVAEKAGLSYNRWYPAISCYNFAAVTVNFGQPNLRAAGYPLDFYVLAGCSVPCLAGALADLQRAQFGFRRLDLARLVALDDEERGAGAAAPRAPDAAADTAAERGAAGPEQVLARVYATITQEDVQRSQGSKQEYKNFLRNVYGHLQQPQKHVELQLESPELQDMPNKGFRYLPQADTEVMPFTQLYMRRAQADFSQTVKAIDEGLYNAFLHNEISKLLHDRQKRGKR